jgi:hypothetical protein
MLDVGYVGYFVGCIIVAGMVGKMDIVESYKNTVAE